MSAVRRCRLKIRGPLPINGLRSPSTPTHTSRGHPVTERVHPAVTAGTGSGQGERITDLAQQHGVSRESLVQIVQAKIRQAREGSGQPPLDQTTLDQITDRAFERGRGQHDGTADAGATEPASAAGYTASAQRVAGRTGVSGTISILA